MIADCMKRSVISIPDTATIRQAAALIVDKHIGILPVVDKDLKPIGVIHISNLLKLEMPDFFDLLPDLDFVHDFGAVETTRPTAEELDRPVTEIMQRVTFVQETSGLLRSYAFMMKHNLYDLPVVSKDGALVGVASRVDIGSAILSAWKNVEMI